MISGLIPWDWSSDNDVFSFPSTVTRYLCLSSIISIIIYLWSYFKHPPSLAPLSVSPRCGSGHLWPSLLCPAVLMKMSRGVDGLFTTIGAAVSFAEFYTNKLKVFFVWTCWENAIQYLEMHLVLKDWWKAKAFSLALHLHSK